MSRLSRHPSIVLVLHLPPRGRCSGSLSGSSHRYSFDTRPCDSRPSAVPKMMMIKRPRHSRACKSIRPHPHRSTHQRRCDLGARWAHRGKRAGRICDDAADSSTNCPSGFLRLGATTPLRPVAPDSTRIRPVRVLDQRQALARLRVRHSASSADPVFGGPDRRAQRG